MLDQATFDFSLDLIPLNSYEQEVHQRALARAGNYRRAEGELIEVIDEVDQLRLFEKFRLTSTFAYCTTYLKLSEAVAYYFITVTRKSREIPELKTAIASGNVTVSKAARICSVITDENKSQWIAKAKESTQKELERAVVLERPEKPKRAVLRASAENRSRLSFDTDTDFIRDLARVQNLESKRTSKATEVSEALRAALRAYLKTSDPVEKAKRAENRKQAKVVATELRKPIALIQPDSAQPESMQTDSVQPESRAIPAEALHQVNLRDLGRCQARLPDGKICGETRFTEIHHIELFSRGGPHELKNLVTLCSAHHSQWHIYDERSEV